jgi:hypothetical protein
MSKSILSYYADHSRHILAKKCEDKLSIFIGILAIIVIIYRISFLAIPMFMEGFVKNDVKIMFESLTLLV